MSSKFQTILLIGIALVVVMLLLRPQQPQQTQQVPSIQELQITQPEERSVVVSGDGEIKVAPDTADFNIKIKTDDKELTVAKENNAAVTQKVMAVLKEKGIPEEDIYVDLLRVQADSVGTRIYRYYVNNLIKVTARDLVQFEPLLTALQEIGDIEIVGMVFKISKITNYEEQALQMAVGAAQEKAQAIARKMGLEIGKIITIQETYRDNSGDYITFDTFILNNPDSGYGYNNASNALSEITIRVKVTVTFELK